VRAATQVGDEPTWVPAGRVIARRSRPSGSGASARRGTRPHAPSSSDHPDASAGDKDRAPPSAVRWTLALDGALLTTHQALRGRPRRPAIATAPASPSVCTGSSNGWGTADRQAGGRVPAPNEGRRLPPAYPAGGPSCATGRRAPKEHRGPHRAPSPNARGTAGCTSPAPSSNETGNAGNPKASRATRNSPEGSHHERPPRMPAVKGALGSKVEELTIHHLTL